MSITVKRTPRGRELFHKYRHLLYCIASFFDLFPRSFRLFAFYMMQRKRGKMGLALRYALLRTLAKKVGDNVSIHSDVYLFHLENLVLGDNVSIHPFCYIEASGGVQIGSDVSIAHGVTLMSETHVFDQKKVAIKDQGLQAKEVCIENNVWIGAKATILGGNKVSTGAIVAASAVVTKPVPPYAIVAGVPAKVIKIRE